MISSGERTSGMEDIMRRIDNLTIGEVTNLLKSPELLLDPASTSPSLPIPVLEALLLLRRYSSRQSPSDIARAASLILQLPNLQGDPSLRHLYFVLASHSVDVFERTSELGHLDRAVALLEDLWDEQTIQSMDNMRFMVGSLLSRSCLCHYLTSGEPKARESAVNVFHQICSSSPGLAASSNTSVLLILGDIMRHSYVTGIDFSEPFLSVSSSVLRALKIDPNGFTAFQILVVSLVYSIIHEEQGTWLNNMTLLLAAVEESKIDGSDITVLLNAVATFPSSSSKPLCLLYISYILDSQGLIMHDSSYEDDGGVFWTEESRKAVQHFRQLITHEGALVARETFQSFSLKGHLERRPILGVERYFQPESKLAHTCMFKLSMVVQKDVENAPSADISHETFFIHLEKLCNAASPDQLRDAALEAEDLDRFLDISPYLRQPEERLRLWRNSPTTKAYIMFRTNMKDRRISIEIANTLYVHLDDEPGYAHFVYQLASNLCSMDANQPRLTVASHFFLEFFRVQKRGSLMHILAMVELATTHFLLFFRERRRGQISTIAFALELFREAVAFCSELMESSDPWFVEARKVLLIARILHYRYNLFSESETSLQRTFAECNDLLDHLPIGLPFCASTLEVITINSLLFLARHTKNTLEWHKAIKYLASAIDQVANGTNHVSGMAGDEDASIIVDVVLKGGVDPANISFGSEALHILHISDVFRTIGGDCCKNPGHLRISIECYLRDLEFEPTNSLSESEKVLQNVNDLRAHSLVVKAALRSAVLSLVGGEHILNESDDSRPASTPGSFLIFKYRAGYLNDPDDNPSAIGMHATGRLLCYTPVKVSQFYLDTTGDNLNESDEAFSSTYQEDGSSSLASWPDDLLSFKDAAAYVSSADNMPSTLIPGFDQISNNEAHELFKMPLEPRTIRALVRNVDSEIRSTEKSTSFLAQNYINELRKPPLWNRNNVGLQARIEQIKNFGHNITQYGSIQALLTRGPERCLELIESARTMFWTRLLRLKTSFVCLPDDLAKAFEVVAKEIEILQANTTFTADNTWLDQSQRLFELEVTFEKMVSEARTIPGFKNFLRPKSYEMLMQASSTDGPIVILLGSNSIYAALVVQPTGVDHVFLPGVTDDVLDRLALGFNRACQSARSILQEDESVERFGKRRRKAMPDYNVLLQSIWELVVKPVFDFLSYLSHPKALDARSRLWWCPTGKFTFLPIHAAGTNFGTPNADCVSNYAVSSYIPTLSMLISARDHAPKLLVSELKVLVLAQPETPGHASLPMTLNELELVESIVPSSQLLHVNKDVPQLSASNSNRTVSETLEALPQASILHLACHGHQDSKDPLNSGFALADGRLSLGKLIACHTPDAFFAFLSACESAAGDAEVPDESLSLSVAMLYAGFRSVIGTMWMMNDNDGPEVARSVYQALFKDPSRMLDPNAIPFALDAAVRKLQESGVHPSRWATYAHIGV
ncbi:hypothetical protein D9613_011377 [Agrocybe pediades]|uniref:CHAT domain-containing protein n=1 Tax=Agrocybe pediades TaxID=84607 RepID=A0A8H4VN41_9AGAR|nr:hypothetical protein D9613_011377 [Agrocybe pediades]